MSNFGRGSFLIKAEPGRTLEVYQDLFLEGRPPPVGSRRETDSFRVDRNCWQSSSGIFIIC